jgi:ribose/xylose/arabinose/galactoside ABC-type transport system permease subunit
MSMAKQNKSSLSANLDWDILWERFGIAAVLLLGWIIAYFFVPKFSNPDNMFNVIRQSAFVGCAAVGMTVAIMSGTFDLSVGSTLALSAYLGLIVVSKTKSIPLAMLTSIGAAMAVGTVNGLLVTRIKIPAFITTLGMLFIVRGLTFIISNGGEPVRYNGKAFIWWGNGSLFGIPIPFLVFILCALVGWFILTRTAFGRYVFSIGTNSNAAKVAGVPVDSTTTWIFIVVGLFTGISAFLLGSRLYSAGPGLEPGFELNVIAAVVLGGTRLAGGRGSMIGTVAACLLYATMGNVLNLLHADAFFQRVAVGFVLLIALSIEGIRQRMFERASRRVSNVKSESNV